MATPNPIAPGTSRRKIGHIKTFGTGRVCSSVDCDTALSRYNDATVCWHHDNTKTKVSSGRARRA
jgi:hypothetical protein